MCNFGISGDEGDIGDVVFVVVDDVFIVLYFVLVCICKKRYWLLSEWK